MVQYSAGGGPALRGGMVSAAGRARGEGKSRDGRTAFAVFLTDNLEFTRTVPLNPALNPGEPCV
jgi:hypothetical protein